jgi:hypothetical protein
VDFVGVDGCRPATPEQDRHGLRMEMVYAG